MKTTTYNGWSNKATWLASMWLNNDPMSQRVLLDALGALGDSFDKASVLQERLSKQLDQEIDVPCLWLDLLKLAFSQVNWVEVIERN